MQRYFFDVHNGVYIRDDTGTDLSGEAAAHSHALMTATAYVNDPSMLDSDGGSIVIDVRNASDRLFTVRLVFTVASG